MLGDGGQAVGGGGGLAAGFITANVAVGHLHILQQLQRGVRGSTTTVRGGAA